MVHGCPPNPLAFVQPWPARRPTMVKMAWPPIQVWMPNQPQATSARSSAARLARAARRSPGEDREGDAVLGARVAVQQHRDEHQEVGDGDGQEGLQPAHAQHDQPGGQHAEASLPNWV
jgi:hypothetical protein